MQCVITPHFIARDPFSYEVEIWFAIDIPVSHEINVSSFTCIKKKHIHYVYRKIGKPCKYATYVSGNYLYTNSAIVSVCIMYIHFSVFLMVWHHLQTIFSFLY